MSEALQLAKDTATANGYTCDGVRYRDTQFPDQPTCFLIAPGLVVYEDEPDCVVSVERRDGRFIPEHSNH